VLRIGNKEGELRRGVAWDCVSCFRDLVQNEGWELRGVGVARGAYGPGSDGTAGAKLRKYGRGAEDCSGAAGSGIKVIHRVAHR